MDQTMVAFDDDVWELYNGSKDWTQARNLANEHPEMLYKLQRLFLIEATKFNVLPLDDRGTSASSPRRPAGRPSSRGTPALYPAWDDCRRTASST